MLESDRQNTLRELEAFAATFRSLEKESDAQGQVKILNNIGGILRFLQSRTLPHFEIEESVIFPHLTHQVPSLRGIFLSLAKEHRLMRRELLVLQRLHRRAAKNKAVSVPVRKFARRGRALLARMQSHIKKEVRLMESHPI